MSRLIPSMTYVCLVWLAIAWISLAVGVDRDVSVVLEQTSFEVRPTRKQYDSSDSDADQWDPQEPSQYNKPPKYYQDEDFDPDFDLSNLEQTENGLRWVESHANLKIAPTNSDGGFIVGLYKSVRTGKMILRVLELKPHQPTVKTSLRKPSGGRDGAGRGGFDHREVTRVGEINYRNGELFNPYTGQGIVLDVFNRGRQRGEPAYVKGRNGCMQYVRDLLARFNIAMPQELDDRFQEAQERMTREFPFNQDTMELVYEAASPDGVQHRNKKTIFEIQDGAARLLSPIESDEYPPKPPTITWTSRAAGSKTSGDDVDDNEGQLAQILRRRRRRSTGDRIFQKRRFI
ncbi:MAG: hypothetical protein M1825_003990 [Sarcosagium campestre]|nr:MAG: hypothetical protein M1825_003990 [Sarcosagium campestre]